VSSFTRDVTASRRNQPLPLRALGYSLVAGALVGTAPAGATTTTATSAGKASVGPPLSATTSPAAPLAAARLLAASIGAANAQRGFVWKATLRGGGNDITELSHAGRLDGTEVITGYRGPKRVLMSLVVIGPQAYAWGNAGALETLLGFKVRAAAKEAGRWISVPQSTFGRAYGTIAAGLTVSSATQALDLVGKLSLLPEQVVAGQVVIGVRGTSLAFGAPGAQTVYIRANGLPLPVEMVEGYQGVSETMTFGQWGQPPVAKAPLAPVMAQQSWLA
jgi:hypothetical protein